MIIACPACTTRYVVPDNAIGIDGRTVRCAKCRHSWHQEGAKEDVPGGEVSVAPNVEPDEKPGTEQESTIAQTAGAPAPDNLEDNARFDREANAANPIETAPPPAASAPSSATVSDDPFDDPYENAYDDDRSQFDHRPPFRPRRNPLKIWTAAGVIFALLAFGGVLAASYYGLPEWLPVNRPTFAVAEPDLALDFPADQQDRRTLPDGSEFFSASGTITNTGRETRNVPPILIVMRNEREVPVYSWVLAPPKKTLAPGQSVTINEIATDVPKNAKYAEIGWNPT